MTWHDVVFFSNEFDLATLHYSCLSWGNLTSPGRIDLKGKFLLVAFATESPNLNLDLRVFRLVRYATLLREKHDNFYWIRTRLTIATAKL